MCRRGNRQRSWEETGRRPARLGQVLGGLAFLMFFLTVANVQANSWCDDIDTGGPTIGGLPVSVVAMLDLALDSNLEVSMREKATLGLCRVAKKGDRKVTDALAILTTDSEPTIRAASLQTLAILGTGDHRDLAIRSLDDKSPQVRLKAVFALTELDCKGCLDALVKTLGDPAQQLAVRESAAIAIAKRQYEPALPALRAQLSDGAGGTGEAGNLPLYSALALSALKDDSGMTVLASAALASDTREGLRVKSILAIESLTSQQFGYVNKYYAPTTREQREAALDRLAGWWKANGGEVGK